MFPIAVFVSERRAANLLAQIRWRDGVYCPRCRAESVVRGSSPAVGRTRWTEEQDNELTLVAACHDVFRVVSAQEGSE